MTHHSENPTDDEPSEAQVREAWIAYESQHRVRVLGREIEVATREARALYEERDDTSTGHGWYIEAMRVALRAAAGVRRD